MELALEPMSAVDSAWLAMDAPNNLMMICGILTFRERLDFETFKVVVRSRFLRSRRFRQRLVHPQVPYAPPHWSPPFWGMDPTFDLANHVHELTLAPSADGAALRDVISELISTPLDMERPLWSMHLIQDPDGGSTVVERTHHCIADGVGQLHMQFSMCDDSPGVPVAEHACSSEPERGTLPDLVLDSVFTGVRAATGTMVKAYGRVLHEAFSAVFRPGHVVDLAQRGVEEAETVRRLLLQDDDPATLFKGPLGTSKRVAWSDPVPLSEVRLVKDRLGGTVNDVLVCALAGGMRRYLVRKGAAVDGLNVRAAIPVNLRDSHDSDTLGNKFGLVFLSLPIGIEDPEERLGEQRQRMLRLKHSREAPIIFGLLRSLGHTPPQWQSPLVRAFGGKITTVMSNVPGPTKPLYFGGHKIDQMMFYVPQAGRVGLGISMLSYGGEVLVGINSDQGLVPDPEFIIDGFYEEFAVLMERAEAACPPWRCALP